jgi:hypothetical protein
MSPYERRAGIKIVTPPNQEREQELIGGIRNALERGESIEKAKQSFLNAGYKQNEIAIAVQKIPAGSTHIIPTTTSPTHATIPGKPFSTSTIPTTIAPKKKSKLLLIILIIISVLILVGAGLIGIFWNSWFGG